MIPTRAQCLLLFDRYKLPSEKRIHVEAVTKLALFFANKLTAHPSTPLRAGSPQLTVNKELVEAAALLHDIDKNIPKREGERHPDTAVRILQELGFPEVAQVVKRHSLYTILDVEQAPQTWEEKIVYLADKMTKYEVIGVNHRFKLWYKENLPPAAVLQLNQALPKVKVLEQEIYRVCGITWEDVRKTFQIR